MVTVQPRGTALVIAADIIFRLLRPGVGVQEIDGPFFVSVTILLGGCTFGCIIGRMRFPTWLQTKPPLWKSPALQFMMATEFLPTAPPDQDLFHSIEEKFMSEKSKTSATDKMADRAHEAVDKASESFGRAEERIRDRTEGAQARSEDLIQKVTDYVHDNPLTSLGLAFAAGVIFSSMNRRG